MNLFKKDNLAFVCVYIPFSFKVHCHLPAFAKVCVADEGIRVHLDVGSTVLVTILGLKLRFGKHTRFYAVIAIGSVPADGILQQGPRVVQLVHVVVDARSVF